MAAFAKSTKMQRMAHLRFLFVAFLLAGFVHSLSTQKQQQESDNSAVKKERKYKSDYHDVSEFGGPGSVGYDFRESDKEKKPILRFPVNDEVLKRWFGFSKNLLPIYLFVTVRVVFYTKMISV